MPQKFARMESLAALALMERLSPPTVLPNGAVPLVSKTTSFWAQTTIYMQ